MGVSRGDASDLIERRSPQVGDADRNVAQARGLRDLIGSVRLDQEPLLGDRDTRGVSLPRISGEDAGPDREVQAEREVLAYEVRAAAVRVDDTSQIGMAAQAFERVTVRTDDVNDDRQTPPPRDLDLRVDERVSVRDAPLPAELSDRDRFEAIDPGLDRVERAVVPRVHAHCETELEATPVEQLGARPLRRIDARHEDLGDTRVERSPRDGPVDGQRIEVEVTVTVVERAQALASSRVSGRVSASSS